MDEKALLDAIRAIVQEENKPITMRLDTMQADIAGVQTDMTSMQTDITNMRTDMSGMQTDIAEVKDRVTRIEVTQENQILPNIQQIAEGHSGIVDRLDHLEELPEQVEDIQNTVSVLNHVFKTHSHT